MHYIHVLVQELLVLFKDFQQKARDPADQIYLFSRSQPIYHPNRSLCPARHFYRISCSLRLIFVCLSSSCPKVKRVFHTIRSPLSSKAVKIHDAHFLPPPLPPPPPPQYESHSSNRQMSRAAQQKYNLLQIKTLPRTWSQLSRIQCKCD